MYRSVTAKRRTSSLASSSDRLKPMAVRPVFSATSRATSTKANQVNPSCRAFKTHTSLFPANAVRAFFCPSHSVNGCISSSASLSSMWQYVSQKYTGSFLHASRSSSRISSSVNTSPHFLKNSPYPPYRFMLCRSHPLQIANPQRFFHPLHLSPACGFAVLL